MTPEVVTKPVISSVPPVKKNAKERLEERQQINALRVYEKIKKESDDAISKSL